MCFSLEVGPRSRWYAIPGIALLLLACCTTETPASDETPASEGNQARYLLGTEVGAYSGLTYESTTTPSVLVPEAGLYDDSVSPPLEVEGTDTGEPGVMYAAGLSGYFLIRVQQSDGSYKYEYRPDTGEFLWQDVIHRQIGPGYALTLLYEELKRPEFARSAEWVFDYAVNRLVDAGDGAQRITDIGATSIFVFGLSRLIRSEAPTESNWDPTLRALGQHLLDLQNEDGSFSQGSPLAQGQAVQALAHLWLTYQEDLYLEALTRAANYTCSTWETISPDTLPYFILYANEALATLYNANGDTTLPECVYAMTEGNLQDQYLVSDTNDASWVGGFNKSSGWTPSWSAALKLEAIADAMDIALQAGDAAQASMYEERLRLGLPFVMRFQWRIGETEGWPKPETILGGFPYLAPGSTGDLAWPLSRTDLAWHGIAFYVKAARMLDEEHWPNNPHD